MNQPLSEQAAAQLLAVLPPNISIILKNMPFNACWALAAAIDELRTGRAADDYNRGIAIGFVSASLLRGEITEAQHNKLALFVGNLP